MCPSDVTSIAVAVVEHEGRVLIGQRPPGTALAGYWEFPGGKIGAGERAEEAARRECLEETGLITRTTDLIDVFAGQEHPRGAHIVIAFRADVLGGALQFGDDVDAVAYFSLHDLPALAFRVTQKILSQIGN